MRLRDHLTYANIMATIAVFGVLAGGSAYAVSKVDTQDIANQAISTKKIQPGAVTGKKLADGAVASRHLDASAPVAAAGLVVRDGQVHGSFNRLSDQQPTVFQSQPGVYEISIPGLTDPTDPAADPSRSFLSSVSLDAGSGTGEVASAWGQDSGGTRYPVVLTYDSDGNAANRSFSYLLYPLEH